MADSATIPGAARSALLGFLTGSRTMTPLATMGAMRDRPSLGGAWTGWPVLRSPAARALLVLAAAGELVADKLPATPSRTQPGALLGRLTVGAVVGGALGTVPGGVGAPVGAVLGAAGALAGSFAGRWVRTGGTATGLPDLVFALVEDAATVLSTVAVVAASS